MRTSTLIATALASLLAPATLRAQAWVPPHGEGSVAIIYQNALVRDHLTSDGGRLDAGHILSNSVLLDFTYGVTDKLALNINLPYISSVYHGSKPHKGSLLDDGRAHATFQDFRINLRYNVANRGTVVTPFVDVIVPSHRYDYFGHAAPGRRLAELQLGVYLGHVLARGLPGTFVQARYSYGFSQRPLGAYHDRSNADLEFGYFVNPKLRVFALTATQYTLGGLPLRPNFPTGLTAAEYQHHDQISRTDLMDLVGGAQYQITRRMNLVGSYATTVVGRSGHALGRGLTLGASWSFGKSSSGGDLIGADLQPKRALPKCLCPKGRSGP